MKFVESFGNLDEMRYHFTTSLDSFAVENLFLTPKSGLIESTSELDDVGRLDEFLSRHPFATYELIRLNSFEQGQVDESELTSYAVRFDFEYVKDDIVKSLVGIL